MACPFCGSERIEIGIAWGKLEAKGGNVGLKYTNGKGLIAPLGVAQAYSDLCLDCKTILRTYIKEDTDKNWVYKPGSIGTK